jgi:hypothetical protein
MAKVGRKKLFKGKTKSILLKLSLTDYKTALKKGKAKGHKSLVSFIRSQITK